MYIINFKVKKENIKTDNLSKEQLEVFNSADIIENDGTYLYGTKKDRCVFTERATFGEKYVSFPTPNFLYKKNK